MSHGARATARALTPAPLAHASARAPPPRRASPLVAGIHSINSRAQWQTSTAMGKRISSPLAPVESMSHTRMGAASLAVGWWFAPAALCPCIVAAANRWTCSRSAWQHHHHRVPNPRVHLDERRGLVRHAPTHACSRLYFTARLQDAHQWRTQHNAGLVWRAVALGWNRTHKS